MQDLLDGLLLALDVTRPVVVGSLLEVRRVVLLDHIGKLVLLPTLMRPWQDVLQRLQVARAGGRRACLRQAQAKWECEGPPAAMPGPETMTANPVAPECPGQNPRLMS